MSSIKKSASFRSRIPVRRPRLPQRRCSSPQPTTSTTSFKNKQNRNQSNNPLWYDRRYSSSSFSSSDESHESEAPLQLLFNPRNVQQSRRPPTPSPPTPPEEDVEERAHRSLLLLKQTTSTNQGIPRMINVSTDAMSLDGLLDSVSSGSFSSPSSPRPRNKQFTDLPRRMEQSSEQISSYESLDKFNYALETLKLTDNYHDKNKVIDFLQNTANNNCSSEKINNTKILINNNGLLKNELLDGNTGNCIVVVDDVDGRGCGVVGGGRDLPTDDEDVAHYENDEDVQKQKQLSDWYYIKTSPKPKQISPYIKRKRIYNNNNTIHNNNNNNTNSNNNNNINVNHNEDNGNYTMKSDEYNINKNVECNIVNNDEENSSRKIFEENRNKFEKMHQQQQQQQLSKHLLSSPIQKKYKSNDLIPKQYQQQQQQQSHRDYQQYPDKILPSSCKYLINRKLKNNNQTQQYGQQPHQPHHQHPHHHHFGEMTSSSFEHVNVKCNLPEITPVKLLNNQISSNSCCLIKNLNSEISDKFNILDSVDIDAATLDNSSKYKAAMLRPLPKLPSPPTTPYYDGDDDDINVTVDKKFYPTKNSQQTQEQPQLATTPTSYRTECELSGSYVSLECPSPPGPPACLSDNRRDPQARLARYLKIHYTELAFKETEIPGWAQSVATGALCPARLEPELRLHIQSHGVNECISVDQLLAPIQTKEGSFLDAPRRVLIECPPWAARSSLAIRILHAWAREPPWPPRGQPVVLTLFIPLNELKGSLSNYIGKELLPKGPPNPFATGFGGFNSAWNTLESLKGKLLIVLDGYDVAHGLLGKSRKTKNTLQDVVDLLEGRLFPEARVILISVTQNCSELLPLMQRHVTLEGLTWGRSASLLGGGQWGAPTRLLDTVQECVHLRNIARTPLGCLAISAMYESTAGDLPTDEIDVIEAVLNSVAPNVSQSHVAELGRLALFSLKTKRSAVTTAEIRMYCSAPQANVINCLEKAPLFGRTAKRKNEHLFTTICPGIAEFLAANYLVSLASRPGLLLAEIAGLSLGDGEVEPEILKVLTFAMGLLGGRAHILLSRLTPLWLSPQTIFSLALAAGDTTSNLNALSEVLGITKSPPISPLETNPIWIQIKSSPTELQGWGLALKSPTCALKNLELIYQFDKNIILDSRNGIDIFLDALSRNESVTTLRISSLIENDIRDQDILHLANCITKALLKPRLENFELILTLLEEDPPVLKLQGVVTALCRTIPRQPKLGSILLDLGLCTSQLVQICSTLEKCPHVTRLSLPHLRCERGAIGALAGLLAMRPLSSLALPSCWGARDDPPSSSGVSMGSGSGSSSGNSGLIKQSSLTGAPSPRSYPPGLFSSLPRGALVPASNMGRSATLPRQPIEGPPDKRSTDSVVSRTWYPTPACDGGPHNSGTLHDLLLAAREPFSKLHGLDLSKAQLSLEDSMCLGETVRLSTTLHSIKLEGASRLSEILPTVLGASESPSLQMMSLASHRLVLEDAAVGMCARALGSCITLRLLSLDGWNFRIENISTLDAVRGFLSLTSVRELGLTNCRFHLPMFKSDNLIQLNSYLCRSVVVLKMSGAQIVLSDHVPLRGPQILPYLTGFQSLRELDLSAPARSAFGSSSTSAPLILDDKQFINFFQTLHSQYSTLNTLKICNWIIHLDDAKKTLKTVSKSFKNSPISHIKMDGISIMDRPRKQHIVPQFMQILLTTLPQLRWMGITLAGMNDEQIQLIGASLADFKGMEIDIRLSESTIDNARLITQSIGQDSVLDIRVSTFGTSNSILIHAQKVF